MSAKFHEGEIAVQRRAGVPADAPLGSSLRTTIPPAAERFLGELPFVVVASKSADGAVWASLLSAGPGFALPLDEQTLALRAPIAPHDPLVANLAVGNAPVGILAIDVGSRRRVRLNGRAEMLAGGEVRVHIGEVFFNCPQYIQLRALRPDPAETSARLLSRDRVLSVEQVCRISRADTFFIASAHPQRGADASHRGGNPGFVRVESPRRLLFPDYSGNNMFQTLGNLQVNPRCGLLFVNFDSGSSLQLTGTATILWEDPRLPQFPGALRLIEFSIAEVIETQHALAWLGPLLQLSPNNPPSTL